ncbi:MAG: 50S ribosomal protein L37Ae [Candidatus Micrarchaeota archaeon]|nr:MAG: 50S ribosomal protein L37Ae [Candidatus Micrarchaeota archaeon]
MVKFSVRSGARLRRQFYSVLAKKKKLYQCPSCGQEKVKRVSTSIFVCKNCSTKFAGGAFELVTANGDSVRRRLEQLFNKVM